MTITPDLKRSERKIAEKLDDFSQRYSNLNAVDKKNSLPQFFSLCKKAYKKPPLFKKIAEVYLRLQVADQQTCLKEAFPAFENYVLQKLPYVRQKLAIDKIPCFYPLLLLAEDCTLQPVAPSIKRMHPLYNTLLTALRAQSLVLNQLIEQKFPSCPLSSQDLPFKTLLVNRSGLPLRTGICTLNDLPFFIAGTTTHQRLQAPDQTIETDPYADDGIVLEVRLEDRALRFVSITDGGGRGDGVVETAELINRLFLASLVANAQHVQSEETAGNLLLQAVFSTQQELRKFPHIQHATHASLLSVYTDRNEHFGAVSLLGDTTAFLLKEIDHQIVVEKLSDQDFAKQVSHSSGDFSTTGDYSSLTIATFRLPPVKRACIILGTDGLADNLDPRNCLRPELNALIDVPPENYYKKHTISLASRTLSVSDALMNAHDQKDFQTYAASHLYPTPWTLHDSLNQSPLTPAERTLLDSISVDAAQTWHGPTAAPPEQLALLVDLYAQMKIRTLYSSSTPETFAASLANEARAQGKSDDILVAVTWLTD
jgi:hypothetical protein